MVDDIRELKSSMRAAMRKKRLAMTADEKSLRDGRIFERLKGLWAFRNSDTVFCYVSTDIEAGTLKIIEYSLETGRKVAVPRCTEKSGEMFFYYINGIDELSPGHFGVLEPPEDKSKEADIGSGLCVVPGLSFDRQGYRLGYGKGYYDRFLSVFGGQAVGLCYEECMSEKIPHGRYDRTVPVVVTDKRISIVR